MSTTVYPITNSNIYTSGQYGDGQTNAVMARTFIGLHTTVDLVAIGTDLTVKINLAATGPVIQASIDGGAFSSLSLPGSANVWTDVTVFTGLSDAAHTVRIRSTSGTTTNIAIDLVNSFSLTGAAPSLSAPANFGPMYACGGPSFRKYGLVEGGYVPVSTSGYTYPPIMIAVNSVVDTVIRFKAKCSAIRLWTTNNAQNFRVSIDGSVALTSKVTVPNTSIFDWVTLASGLDNTTEHEYQIVAVTASPFNYCYSVMLVGTGITAAATPRGTLVALGDSISCGVGTSDSTLAYVWQICQSKGYAPINRSVSGSVLITGAGVVGGTNFAEQAAAISVGNIRPDVVICLYGYNDATSASFNATRFEQCYSNFLAVLAPFYALGTKVYCLGILNTSQATASANRSAVNTAISNVVTAAANANAIYVNTDSWIVPGTDTTDGTHPNAAGYTKVFTQLGSIIPTWGAPAGGNLFNSGGLIRC